MKEKCPKKQKVEVSQYENPKKAKKSNYPKNKKVKIMTIATIILIAVVLCIVLNLETIKKIDIIQTAKNMIVSMSNTQETANNAD